jgi:hypothetical protein
MQKPTMEDETRSHQVQYVTNAQKLSAIPQMEKLINESENNGVFEAQQYTESL